MKRQDFVKTVVIGLMAIAFIIPSLAGAAEQTKKKQEPVLETSKTTIGSEVINQEVIQILRKGEMAKVTLNIAGPPVFLIFLLIIFPFGNPNKVKCFQSDK